MLLLTRLLREWWWSGYGEYSAATLDRLIYSAHVRDLRLIVTITTVLAITALVLIVVITLAGFGVGPKWFLAIFGETVPQGGSVILDGGAAGRRSSPAGASSSDLYKILMPLQTGAIVAGLGAIVAWAYQTGSGRLGTVDLFACEIATLCRIWTVDGVVDDCVAAYEAADKDKGLSERKKRRDKLQKFNSVEKYTPIFDTNAKELRNLDVKVLINMTAFYTYWKATSDAYRFLANLSKGEADSKTKTDPDTWRDAVLHLVYMQFLTCESARKAIRDLVEFEPNNAENTITILLSELPAYEFLMRCLADKEADKEAGKEDVRFARLKLRLDRYRTVVPKVCCQVHEGREKFRKADIGRSRFFRSPDGETLEDLRRDWDKADRMLPDLEKRYAAISGHFPPARPSQRRRAAQGSG
jgi:hypothetical protein